MKKAERLLNKIEDNYKSFLWFVAKLIFWAVILTLLLPLLAGLFFSIFNKSADLTNNDFILFITAAFIIAYTYETQKQARAIEKTLENQLHPYVDVGMIFDKKWKATRFQFINKSKIAASVWLNVEIFVDGKSVERKELRKVWQKNDKHLFGKERIHIGFRPRITGATFLNEINSIEKSKSVEVLLSIEVAPLFDFREEHRYLIEKRHYVFNRDNGGDWIYTEWWGMPDTIDSEIQKLLNG